MVAKSAGGITMQVLGVNTSNDIIRAIDAKVIANKQVMEIPVLNISNMCTV